MLRVKPSRYFATNGMGLTSSPFHNNKFLPLSVYLYETEKLNQQAL